MRNRSGAKRLVVVAAIGIAACVSERGTSDVAGPRIGGGTGRVYPLRVVAGNYDKLQFPRGKSDFQCTITSKHADGLYRSTVAWLRMPAQYRDPGGAVEVYAMEWRPDAGSPAGGAKCLIPRTPEAEKFLHERVFYIDPKTLRSNGPTSAASLQGSAGYFGASMTYSTTLPTVIIIARTPMWMSGSNSRSNPSFGASIPTWTASPYDTYGYVEPGVPCLNDNMTTEGMIGVATAESFLVLPPERMCPITPTPTICLDFLISDCTISAGLGAGDCRTLSPYARPGQSRAQIVIPLDEANASQAIVYVSPSCWRGSVVCNAPRPMSTDPNDYYSNYVAIAYTGAGIAVRARLQNSITDAVPPIDGSFLIVPQPGGGYDMTLSRDAYPTLTIVESKNGINRVLSNRDETQTRALLGWFGIVDNAALCIPRQ